MNIDNVLLCESATVKDGLLYILGGGIVRTGRPSFPSPLKMTLAVRVMMHRTEADKPHTLEVKLQDADGGDVVNVKVEFGVSDPDRIPPGDEVAVPIPWDFPKGPMLPHPGDYSFELLIDGHHQRAVPFTAVLEQGAQDEPQ